MNFWNWKSAAVKGERSAADAGAALFLDFLQPQCVLAALCDKFLMRAGLTVSSSAIRTCLRRLRLEFSNRGNERRVLAQSSRVRRPLFQNGSRVIRALEKFPPSKNIVAATK